MASVPRDPRNNCFTTKGPEPFTEQVQFRATHTQDQKINQLAEAYGVERADVLRAMVENYVARPSHFPKRVR